MTDILIRDVPDEVIAGLDAHAGRLGLSRSEYVRRRLAQDAARPGSEVSVRDLAKFAETSECDRLAGLRPEPTSGTPRTWNRGMPMAAEGRGQQPLLPCPRRRLRAAPQDGSATGGGRSGRHDPF
jgi:Ribbon-helix-helix protein, copG family